MVRLSLKSQLVQLASIAGWFTLAAARDVNCACGYLDPVTKDLWTDTTILYFNETDAEGLGANVDFVELNFRNLYEAGYDTTYRQGATARNLALDDDTGELRLTVNPSTKQHLVMGAGIRTARQDIQYGSFRAGMKPAQKGASSGSALSMYYKFNESQSVQIDLVNGDAGASNAYFRLDVPSGNVQPKNYTFYNVSSTGQAYDLNEWRFDWTKKSVAFTNSLNSSNRLTVTREQNALPSVPGAIYFKHWSNGSPSRSQGPPTVDAKAWIGYIRIFYNSTVTSGHDVFDSQCSILQEATCSTDDLSLRISSEFPSNSQIKWKQIDEKYVPPRWAYYGVIVSGALLAILIVHAVVRRLIRHYSIPKADRPVHPGAYTYKLDRFALHGELTRDMVKQKKKTEKEAKKAAKRGDTPVIRTREIDPDAASLFSVATTAETDGNSVRGFRSLASNKNSKVIASALPTMYYARPGGSHGQSGSASHARTQSRLHESTGQSDDEDEEASILDSAPGTPRARSGSDASDVDREADEAYATLPARPSEELERDDQSAVAFKSAGDGDQTLPLRRKSIFPTPNIKRGGLKFWNKLFKRTPFEASQKVPEVPAPILMTSSRIDYLDGLRGLCCLSVSLVHFNLTFYAGFVSPVGPADAQYGFVKWIRYTISPVFFNANFGIAVFFILSSRLIGIKYFKTGMLQDLAGATFRRIPRLAFPVLCSVALEYFMLGVGATQYLQYVASISWSTWSYAVEFKNVGWFINEFLALLFVQPPQLPAIIYNYCTGVLWTIPVTIQGSWLIFLGVIIVREIKTTWKRFGYYLFCIVMSWYANSWGAFFWVGLAISDLDLNYKYRTWCATSSRKFLICSALFSVLALSLSTSYVQQVLPYSFATSEYSIHPDLHTGLSIGQLGPHAYPEFQLPQLTSLLAGSALLILCDFSSMLQSVFSLRILRALGYYSYSIYLLHGLIFWSWGSWLCVQLATRSLPYWSNILVVFITSYTILGISVYLWTPFADVFSGYAGNALWRRAQGRSFFATMG